MIRKSFWTIRPFCSFLYQTISTKFRSPNRTLRPDRVFFHFWINLRNPSPISKWYVFQVRSQLSFCNDAYFINIKKFQNCSPCDWVFTNFLSVISQTHNVHYASVIWKIRSWWRVTQQKRQNILFLNKFWRKRQPESERRLGNANFGLDNDRHRNWTLRVLLKMPRLTFHKLSQSSTLNVRGLFRLCVS